jgi:DNA polymerase-1
MTDSILDILNKVQESENQDKNSKVLIIDGLNLFLRTFSVNGSLNDLGVPVGGLIGFLKSLAYTIRTLTPTRVIIVFDGVGGSYRRRKLYPEYKANRKPSKRITRWDAFNSIKDEKAAMEAQFSRLLEYLDFLPLDVITMDNIEADDTIAYAAQNILTEGDIIIMSTDRDFLQLVDDRITVWSPIKRIFYTPEKILEEFKVPAYNFLTYKILLGDKSDNIEGVKGLGPKKIPKIFPDIVDKKFDLNEIVSYSSSQEGPMYERVIESVDQLHLNKKLMDLKEVNISGNIKMKIHDQVISQINLLSKNNFIMLYVEDKMGDALGSVDMWLNQHFLKLNSFAKPTDK